MTMMARMTRMTTIEVQFLRHNSTIILFFDRMKYSSSLTRKRGRDWTLNDHNNHEDQGRTGVFPWCVIGWFYFPWNLNLINYSSWFVIWRFCVTREELELLTDIRERCECSGRLILRLKTSNVTSNRLRFSNPLCKFTCFTCLSWIRCLFLCLWSPMSLEVKGQWSKTSKHPRHGGDEYV